VGGIEGVPPPIGPIHAEDERVDEHRTVVILDQENGQAVEEESEEWLDDA
jgi:hypothetical protein